MSLEFTPHARQKFDAYLDAVEDTLRKQGQGREERAAIVDELAGQVCDMLQVVRTPGKPVSEQQVQGVLGRMESAEAFNQADAAPSPKAVSAKPAVMTEDPPIAGWIITGLGSTALYGVALILTLAFNIYIATRQSFMAETYAWQLLWMFFMNPLPIIHLYPNTLASSSITWMELATALLTLPMTAAPLLTTCCGVMILCKLHQSSQARQGWRVGVALTLLFPLIFTYALVGRSVYHLGLTLVKMALRPYTPNPTTHQFVVWMSMLVTVVILLLISLMALHVFNRCRPKRI